MENRTTGVGSSERAPTARSDQPAASASGTPPDRERRGAVVERGFMRLVATAGIIGIAVALGAILGGQHVAGWIIGLVIGLVSVILTTVLWTSRQV